MVDKNTQRLQDIENYQKILAQYTNPQLAGQVRNLLDRLEALKGQVNSADFGKELIAARGQIQNFVKNVQQSKISPTVETGSEGGANPRGSQPEIQAPDVEEEALDENGEPDEVDAEDDVEIPDAEGAQPVSAGDAQPNFRDRLRHEVLGPRNGKKSQSGSAGKTKAEKSKEEKPDMMKDVVVTSSKVVAMKGVPTAENSFTPHEFAKSQNSKYVKNYLKGIVIVAGSHAGLAYLGMALLGPTPAAVVATVLGVTGAAKLLKRTIEFGTNKASIKRVVKNAEKKEYTAVLQKGNAEDASQQEKDKLILRQKLHQEYKELNQKYLADLQEYNNANAANPNDPALIDKYNELNGRHKNVITPMWAATEGGNDSALNKILQERKAAGIGSDAEVGTENAQTALANQEADKPRSSQSGGVMHTQQVGAIYGKNLKETIGQVKERHTKTMRNVGTILTTGIAIAGLYYGVQGVKDLIEWNGTPMRVDPGQDVLATLGTVATKLVGAGALLIAGVVGWKCRNYIVGPFLNTKTPQLDEFSRQVDLLENDNPPDFNQRSKGLKGNFVTKTMETTTDVLATPLGGGYKPA